MPMKSNMQANYKQCMLIQSYEIILHSYFILTKMYDIYDMR